MPRKRRALIRDISYRIKGANQEHTQEHGGLQPGREKKKKTSPASHETRERRKGQGGKECARYLLRNR